MMMTTVSSKNRAWSVVWLWQKWKSLRFSQGRNFQEMLVERKRRGPHEGETRKALSDTWQTHLKHANVLQQ